MRFAALALLLALTRPVCARDPGSVGEMTVAGAGGQAAHTYPIASMLVSMQPAGAPVDAGDQPRTITVLVIGGATPNPFTIGWISGPATRRRVRLTIGDATEPAGLSAYEAEDAQLTFSSGASRGNGAQTFVLIAGHLTINGIRAY